jgi:hypothetical protein
MLAGDLWQVLQFIVMPMIYISVILNIVATSGRERITNAIIIIGFFSLDFYFQDFFIKFAFIALWLLLMGVKFFVSKEILVVMVVFLFMLGYGNPWFQIIAILLYLIIVINFLGYSFGLIAKKEEPEQLKSPI